MTGEIKLKYTIDWGSRFKIDGDIKSERNLSVKGSESYVLGWIREKLRKMENGQLQVVKGGERERDWEQEEKIRKQLWTNEEQIRTGKVLTRVVVTEHICPTTGNAQYQSITESPPRSSSPCKIS